MVRGGCSSLPTVPVPARWAGPAGLRPCGRSAGGASGWRIWRVRRFPKALPRPRLRDRPKQGVLRRRRSALIPRLPTRLSRARGAMPRNNRLRIVWLSGRSRIFVGRLNGLGPWVGTVMLRWGSCRARMKWWRWRGTTRLCRWTTWWPWSRCALLSWAVRKHYGFPGSWRPGSVRRGGDWAFVPVRRRIRRRRCRCWLGNGRGVMCRMWVRLMRGGGRRDSQFCRILWAPVRARWISARARPGWSHIVPVTRVSPIPVRRWGRSSERARHGDGIASLRSGVRWMLLPAPRLALRGGRSRICGRRLSGLGR